MSNGEMFYNKLRDRCALRGMALRHWLKLPYLMKLKYEEAAVLSQTNWKSLPLPNATPLHPTP